MTLKLVMIRCPDNVAPERREVRGGEFSIGRGKDNQWVVADPDRHLSKKHCQFTYGVGEWELQDLSTNGTFLNQASDPIGKGASQKLRNGDRVKFGLYEIEVIIDEEESAREHDNFLAHHDPLPSRSEVRPYQDARLPSSASMLDSPNSPILPADFDPLAPNPEPFSGPTDSDHAPALQSAFRPPAPVAIIPDDWDVDLPAAAPRPQSARPQQAERPPEDAAPAPAKSERRPPAPTAAPPAEAPRRRCRDRGLPARRGAQRRKADGSGEDAGADRCGSAGERHRSSPDLDGARQHQGRVSHRTDDDSAQRKQPARSFRSMTTMPWQPCSASAGAAACRPDEAIAEAFDDLRMHELATISAMQAAVRVLLAQFAPEVIEQKAGGGGLQIHPAQKKAKAWDAFGQLHKSVTQALSDDFDSVFGKAFARAYEQAIEKLTADRASS